LANALAIGLGGIMPQSLAGLPLTPLAAISTSSSMKVLISPHVVKGHENGLLVAKRRRQPRLSVN
jgi:hypothetical protein